MHDRGFTLVELMVALMVFSLAAMALLRLEGATLRSTATLDTAVVAQMVARNVAVETLTDPAPPPVGQSSGSEENGGRSWTWTRQTRNTGDVRVLAIDITVFDQAGTNAAALTIVRPAEQRLQTS